MVQWTDEIILYEADPRHVETIINDLGLEGDVKTLIMPGERVTFEEKGREVPECEAMLCRATYQADLAPTLLVLNAKIYLCGPEGSRNMPLSEFFELDGIKRNILKKGEIITHITLDNDINSWSGDYQKLSLRKSWDFPEAGVAVAWRYVTESPDESVELRIATTALESIPRLHDDLANEALLNKYSINEIASKLRKEVKPVNNTAFPPNYRKKMVEVLCKKALHGLKGVLS